MPNNINIVITHNPYVPYVVKSFTTKYKIQTATFNSYVSYMVKNYRIRYSTFTHNPYLPSVFKSFTTKYKLQLLTLNMSYMVKKLSNTIFNIYTQPLCALCG